MYIFLQWISREGSKYITVYKWSKLCIYFYSGFPEKVLSILQFINEVNYVYIFTVDFQVLSISQFINEVNYVYIFTVDFQRRF